MNFLQRTIHSCFDLIFPPSEELQRVRGATSDDVRSRFCIQIITDGITLSRFSDPTIRALIHEAKFHNNTKAHVLLGELFDIYVRSHAKLIDIIVPVPLSKTRARARGYNQVYEVLKHTSVKHKINAALMVRTRDTEAQTTLKKHEREKNLEAAFMIKDSKIILGKHVLIVDDVMTTGATMRAAKAALLPHAPASITCVSFAH